jgi:hypothetical protein
MSSAFTPVGVKRHFEGAYQESEKKQKLDSPKASTGSKVLDLTTTTGIFETIVECLSLPDILLLGRVCKVYQIQLQADQQFIISNILFPRISQNLSTFNKVVQLEKANIFETFKRQGWRYREEEQKDRFSAQFENPWQSKLEQIESALKNHLLTPPGSFNLTQEISKVYLIEQASILTAADSSWDTIKSDIPPEMIDALQIARCIRILKISNFFNLKDESFTEGEFKSLIKALEYVAIQSSSRLRHWATRGGIKFDFSNMTILKQDGTKRKLEDQDIIPILNAIKLYPNLAIVDFSKNSLTDKSLIIILSFCLNKAIDVLHLSGNRFSDKTVQEVADFVKRVGYEIHMSLVDCFTASERDHLKNCLFRCGYYDKKRVFLNF